MYAATGRLDSENLKLSLPQLQRTIWYVKESILAHTNSPLVVARFQAIGFGRRGQSRRVNLFSDGALLTVGRSSVGSGLGLNVGEGSYRGRRGGRGGR